MNYKTYAEAKIANQDSDIVTTGDKWGGGSEFIGIFEALALDGSVHGGELGSHEISDDAWVICNPADYCSSLKEFLESGFKLDEGDKFIGIDGVVVSVNSSNSSNIPNYSNANRYILSAASLNGGCKIPNVKPDAWTIYNNTLPLRELADEQVGKLVKYSGEVEHMNPNNGVWNTTITPMWNRAGVYRIKSKSERELFIEATTKVMRDAGTKCPDNHEYFGIMFDAGARYTDKTQFFGESI